MVATDHEGRVALAVERLLGGQDVLRRALVRDLAASWPDGPALGLVFALTDAAARIEAMLDSRWETRGAALAGYRYAALVAGDVHALEVGGCLPVRVSDLMHHLRHADPYFLNL